MILIIVGRSGTGKDTVVKYLQEKYNYQRLAMVTDRPIRANERNGINYNFVSPEAFDMMIENNEFYETTSFNTAMDNRPWRYGTPRSIFTSDYKESLVVTILNPKTIEVIQREIPKNKYCICYLISDDTTIHRRLKKRGDNEHEIDRRMLADNLDFTNIVSDITIENSWRDDIDKVARDVHQFFQYYKCGRD